MPIEMAAPIGTLAFDAGTGVTTATITDAASQFPMGSTLRAVALQGYLQQDIDGDGMIGEDDASLHALSVMTAVTGDDVRREVVDSASCSSCHEWFEGHGGNRVLGYGSDVICGMCHNPNQSSSGRTVIDPTARGLDVALMDAIAAGHLDPMVDPNDPRTYPEDAQNFKDLIHGIHSSGFRDRAYQHVRGPSRQSYYDWSEVTFPRGASTSNCSLCHMDGTYELPLAADILATTVRTTGQDDGLDPDLMSAEAAFVNVPNTSDWVNSPAASACYYCHTGDEALAHMSANGALLSEPGVGGWVSNRMLIGTSFESCSVCHGPGRSADVEVVHDF
jgi:OmcA/MtrC family decaheme c-type cytochrome